MLLSLTHACSVVSTVDLASIKMGALPDEWHSWSAICDENYSFIRPITFVQPSRNDRMSDIYAYQPLTWISLLDLCVFNYCPLYFLTSGNAPRPSSTADLDSQLWNFSLFCCLEPRELAVWAHICRQTKMTRHKQSRSKCHHRETTTYFYFI